MFMQIIGEVLGGSRKGIADPIMAGDVKMNNLGVGAHNPGEVTPEDDIYEQYKKRMMLGYRHRPNPLVKPLSLYFFFINLECNQAALHFNIKSIHVTVIMFFHFLYFVAEQSKKIILLRDSMICQPYSYLSLLLMFFF